MMVCEKLPLSNMNAASWERYQRCGVCKLPVLPIRVAEEEAPKLG
jgi:hypothetical protein